MAESSATRPRHLAVILTASGGTFLAMLDSTVTNLAVPDLAESFPTAAVADLSWVISAYAVLFAALLTPAGRLADTLGRRRLFLTGVGLFTIASLLCAVAPNLGVLIGTRALQGAAAAAMIPASLAILLMDGPAERRASSIGIWSATSAFAAAVGPSVGGVLVEVFGWRSVFVINLPFGLLLIFAALRLLAKPGPAERGKLPDLLGTVLVTLGVGALTLAVTKGSGWGWLDTRIVVCFAVGLLALVAAVVRSRSQPTPAIETSLWRNPTFTATNVVSLFYGMAQYPWMLGCVLYLTDVWRYSELEAGLAMSPGAVLASAAALVMGRLAPKLGGPRFATLFGLIAFGACGVWFIFGLTDQPAFVALWLPAGILVGIGMGAATTGTSSAAVMSAPPTMFAGSSGLNNTARQFGGALGIAALAAILALHPQVDGRLGVDAYSDVFLFCTIAVVIALLVTTFWMRLAAPKPAAAPAAVKTS